MMEPTTNKKAESATPNKKKGKDGDGTPKPKRQQLQTLQLQSIVEGEHTEVLGVFKTQREGLQWLSDELEKDSSLERIGVRYQFARLLGNPRALNVEVKVKLK
jgi:hypothetical protein